MNDDVLTIEQFNYMQDGTEPCAVAFDENGRPNDPEKWVGPWTNSATPDVALELCSGCHIIDKCLKYALDNEERDFIWGGTSPDQRKELLRAKRHRTKKSDSKITNNAFDSYPTAPNRSVGNR